MIAQGGLEPNIYRVPVDYRLPMGEAVAEERVFYGAVPSADRPPRESAKLAAASETTLRRDSRDTLNLVSFG